jgi:hypothetical protein
MLTLLRNILRNILGTIKEYSRENSTELPREGNCRGLDGIGTYTGTGEKNQLVHTHNREFGFFFGFFYRMIYKT